MRVFISSTIDTLKEEREVVRSSVRSLGMTPVMAEDFPSLPDSPRAACLNGIEQSDIYLGILGPNYGSPVGELGRSPTEEEYRRAVDLGLPTIWLFKNCERDKDAARFEQEIAGSWAEGHFRTTFSELHELANSTIKALQAQVGTESKNHGVVKQCRSLFTNSLASLREGDRDAQLAFYCHPLGRSRSSDLLKLDEDDTKDSVVTALMIGSSRVFNPAHGFDLRKQFDSVDFLQRSAACSSPVVARIWGDGRSLFVIPATDPSANSDHSSFDFLVIDPRHFENQALCAAITGWKLMEALSGRGPLLFDAAITSPGSRTWGTARGRHSMPYPISTSLPDPLLVSGEPERLRECSDAGRVATRLAKLAARHYEAAGQSI